MFIRGVSSCLICGGIIDKKNGVVSFQAFLPREHRLGKFSDAVMHQECFQDCPEASEVDSLHERFTRLSHGLRAKWKKDITLGNFDDFEVAIRAAVAEFWKEIS